METTQIVEMPQDNSKKSVISIGSVMLIIAGIVIIFLLAMGTWTENRFGTHLVLNTDLSSGPAWFLYLIATVGTLVAIAGIVLLVLDIVGVYGLDENKDRTLKLGSYFLMGSVAFILALSSISFSAFNWQFFKSQMESKNGLADAAIAMMALSIIVITASLGFMVFGFFVEINANDKTFYTLRNTSIALIALGWLVFNLCINSFGAMGGDASILVDGLTGHDGTLTNVGTLLDQVDDVTGLDIFQAVTGEDKPGKFQLVWKNFIAIWDGSNSLTAWGLINGVVPGLGTYIKEHGGIAQMLGNDTTGLAHQLIELGTGKESLLLGTNNTLKSYSIFAGLLGLGLIGLPVYAGLTYNGASKEKTSIMFWGSIITIIAISALYFFLLMTPYMPQGFGSIDYYGGNKVINALYLLLTGNYDPSLAPGLIALPGQEGGIFSAIVYFSDEYTGTAIWWISEVLTFLIPAISFISVALFVKLRK